jgi:hypothetical protein
VRKPADPTARLALLTAARAQVEPGTILNAADMARVAGMTWRNLNITIERDPAFPVVKRGSEGIAWEFNAAAAIDHMIGVCRSVIADNDQHAARIARMAGMDVPASIGAGLSLQDFTIVDRLQREAQRRKIEQRDYVPRREVERLVEGMLGLVQNNMIGRAGKLDPAGKWPAQIRAEIVEEDRSFLVRLHDHLGAWLKDDAKRSRRARSRIGGARTG